jgi:alpha-galactosidase
MAMKIFGRELGAGAAVFDNGKVRIDAAVEKVRGGFKIMGSVRGLAGTIEVFRGPAPEEFLLNNWQSWGPMQKMKSGEKLIGLEERMANYSRYVFTPIPDVFGQKLVSDYLLAWDGGLVGFLASRIGHPYFTIEGSEIAGFIEYFETDFADAVPLEPLIILDGGPVELLFEEYAIRAAAENGVEVSPRNPVGWSSWYHYFTNLTLADVRKNLEIARERFPFEVFEIDDGYEADIGDWLDVKKGFSPLDDLGGLIRRYGYRAGIWTAPFSASETSKIYESHPEWMVADAGLAKPCYRNWGKNVFALDTTHPGVKSHLYETFLLLKRAGFDFFKVDFLFAAAMDGVRSRRVTPIQAYREGLDVIRQAAGSSFILGCGAPLLPSIGFVDGMRVGEDTAPFWKTEMSSIQGPNAYYALRNPILRSFMHKKWWLNDPDCLLLRRTNTGLSANECELYARTAGALDNMIIESDDLELVDAWGRGLLNEAIRLKGGYVRVRGLLEDDVYLVDSWGGPSGIFRFAANLSDATRKAGDREIPPRTGLFIKP